MTAWSSLSRRVQILLGTAAGLLLLFGLSAFWLVRQISPPGSPGAAVEIEIPQGSSASRIAGILDDGGVVTSAGVFRWYVRVTGADGFQAGIYGRGEFRQRMSMGEAVDALQAGPQIEYTRLTIPEGFTLDQIADRVGQLPGRSAEAFLELASSGTVRSKYQPEGTTSLEGLLFPDTYLVAEDETEVEILRRMVTLFEQVADELRVADGAAGHGVTAYEAIVIASLVEEEAKVADERPKMASVVYNRLERGMLLQIDASVLYALGEHKERVLFSDLEVESPYNTYKQAGLTPTPIASPGRASLEAALDPADTEYLFYVVIDENGRHAFAEDQAGHQANIAEAERRGVR